MTIEEVLREMRESDLAAVVRELLSYQPKTGVLRWRHRNRQWFRSDQECRRWNSRYAGTDAGSIKGTGHMMVKILSKSYLLHRIVWLYVYGQLPGTQIDHINGRKTDNRIENLRLADHTINAQNKKSPNKNNKTGLLGVSLDGASGKYVAQIQTGSKKQHLGYFSEPKQAHAAYIHAKKRKHQGFVPEEIR